MSPTAEAVGFRLKDPTARNRRSLFSRDQRSVGDQGEKELPFLAPPFVANAWAPAPHPSVKEWRRTTAAYSVVFPSSGFVVDENAPNWTRYG